MSMLIPFELSADNGDTTFMVDVDGVSAEITIPDGIYDGGSLATVLEERINQMADGTTGQTIGGVSVVYDEQMNSLNFTGGTTGEQSTLSISGHASLGLSGLAPGTGSTPMTQELVQATDSHGNLLYMDAEGSITSVEPDPMMEGFYPLYQDDGVLNFDRTGRLMNGQTSVSFAYPGGETGGELRVDFAGTTQAAAPFSVGSITQDGYPTGNLDGVEVSNDGTVWASYSNGRTEAVGKVVMANFADLNGLKKIGHTTYMATAESGDPIVGEASEGGFGNILSGFLESSNVDLSRELVNLITAQRNYQASAKSIETMNTLTQTLMQIR